MPHVMERRRERRAVQRPVPGSERPFYNFEEIAASLEASVEKRIKAEGVRFNPSKPEFASRLGGVAKNVVHPFRNMGGKNTRNFKNQNWLPIRPLKLAGEMGADVVFSTRSAGAFKFWKERKNHKKALMLNERFEPRVTQMTEEFMAEANAALAELQRLVSEGRITRENRNFYFEKYEKAVREAEIKFQQNVNRLIGDYMKEWKGRKAAA